MAEDDNKKKRTPKDKQEFTYPYVYGHAWPCGTEQFVNSTKDKESYTFVHSTGTYTTIDKDGKRVTLVANAEHKTISQGKTESIEGPHDKLVGGGTRRTDWGGVHHEVAEDYSHGIHGSYARAVHGGMFRFSTGPTEHTSEGGHFNDHNDGDDHNHTAGDGVWSVGGNFYQILGKEAGIYAKGNWDTKIDKKGRLYAEQDFKMQTNAALNIISQSDTKMTSNAKFSANSSDNMSLTTQKEMTITADTKITIKVGGSSITLESGKITIKSASIEFQQG